MEIDYTQVAVEVTKQLAKDVYNDAGHPAAQNVGGAMGTLTGFFNHVVLHPLKKLNIEYEQKAIAWQREMEKKYNAIPEDNRVEPQLNIVGPTLESMKYNIMDDDLAEMFSNLLVSDMDKTTQGLCTPSFVKVIEQMTPNDAKLFCTIYHKSKNNEDLPVCTIKFIMKENPDLGLREEYIPKYFTSFSVMGLSSISLSKSIQNLHRLGLIEVDFLKHYINDDLYKTILNSDEVNGVIQWAKSIVKKDYEAKIGSKGILFLNEFSRDFAKVCLRGQ